MRRSSSNNCPTCGAPLSSGWSERCEYCGAATNPQVTAAKVAANAVENVTKKAWRRSIAFTVGMLLFSGLAALIGQLGTRRAVRKAEQPLAALSRTTPPASTTPKSVVPLSLSQTLGEVSFGESNRAVLFASSRAPDYPLVLLNPLTGKVLWKSPPFGKTVDRNQVIVGKDQLFVADENTLVALRARDGGEVWRTSLMADYKRYSEGLLLSDKSLAVLLQDGTTQAFDPATGKTLWALKQTPPPNRVLGAGKFLLRFGNAGKKRARDAEIVVIDSASGAVVQRLEPRCPTHSIIPPDEPSSSDPMVFSEDGNELYLFYGTFRNCVERWDLPSGRRVWQINHAERGEMPYHSSGHAKFLLGPDKIVYSGSKAVYAIRRIDGEMRGVLSAGDSRLDVDYLRGNLLIVAASATWDGSDCGSAKNCALWAVDLGKAEGEKGNVLWRHNLPTLRANEVSYGSPRFVGAFFPDSFTVLAVVSEGGMVLNRLALDTGVSGFHKQLHFSSTPSGFDWIGDAMWVRAGGDYVAIDGATGAIRFTSE